MPVASDVQRRSIPPDVCVQSSYLVREALSSRARSSLCASVCDCGGIHAEFRFS